MLSRRREPFLLPIEEALRRFEQRKYFRHRVAVKVDLTSDSNFFAGISNDLSEGGVFVATDRLLPRWQHIALEIDLSDGGDPVSAEGEVRWVREPGTGDGPVGMGIQFVRLTNLDRCRIQRFLRSRDTILYED